MVGPFSEVFAVCCLFGRFVKFTMYKFQHFRILKLQNFKISTFQNYISTDCNSSFLAFVAIWSCSVCIRYIDWRANSTLSGWSVKISWFSRNMSIFSCFWYFLESQNFDGFQMFNLQNFKISNFPKIQNLKVTTFQHFTISKYRNFEMSKSKFW